jgi:membrane protein YqaA with SNARE-associated domain
MDLAILFVSAFAALTILPMSSETVLSARALWNEAGDIIM